MVLSLVLHPNPFPQRFEVFQNNFVGLSPYWSFHLSIYVLELIFLRKKNPVIIIQNIAKSHMPLFCLKYVQADRQLLTGTDCENV